MYNEENKVNEDNVKSYEVIIPVVLKGELNVFAETKEEAVKIALEIADKHRRNIFDFDEIDLETLKDKIVCEESEHC